MSTNHKKGHTTKSGPMDWNKLERLGERFIVEELTRDLYEKYSSKIQETITELRKEIENSSKSISNLNSKGERCIDVVQNISRKWGFGDYFKKQRIQKVVFPDGIYINPKTREYRTYSINPVFNYISTITKDSGDKNKNASDKNLMRLL